MHAEGRSPACVADGSNPAVLRKLGWAKRQREQGLPTVPSTIQVCNLLSPLSDPIGHTPANLICIHSAERTKVGQVQEFLLKVSAGQWAWQAGLGLAAWSSGSFLGLQYLREIHLWTQTEIYTQRPQACRHLSADLTLWL